MGSVMDASNLKLVKPGDRPSAEQWNLMIQLLKREVTGPNMVRDSTGWHFRRVIPSSSGVGDGITSTTIVSAHYAGTNETTAPFLVIPNCAHSIVEFKLIVRLCNENGAAALDHHPDPTLRLPVALTAFAVWDTYDGEDDVWHEISYDGDADSDWRIEAELDVDGNVSLRVANSHLTEGSYFNARTIRGIVRVTPYRIPVIDETPAGVEFGNGNDHEELDYGEYKPPQVVWGDGIWLPSDLAD
jgi:hypothetical protein